MCESSGKNRCCFEYTRVNTYLYDHNQMLDEYPPLNIIRKLWGLSSLKQADKKWDHFGRKQVVNKLREQH